MSCGGGAKRSAMTLGAARDSEVMESPETLCYPVMGNEDHVGCSRAQSVTDFQAAALPRCSPLSHQSGIIPSS